MLAMAEGRDVRQFNVYLPLAVIRSLKHHAVDTEQSLSSIVERAVSEYLARVSDAKRQGRKDGH